MKGFILTAHYGGSEQVRTLSADGLFNPGSSTPEVFGTAANAAEALGTWARGCPHAIGPNSFHSFNIVEYGDDDTVALEDVPFGHLFTLDGSDYVKLNPNGWVDDSWSWVVNMAGVLGRFNHKARVLDLGHVDDTTITTNR